MQDAAAQERPTLGGLVDDASDLALGHAGIVLEFQGTERAALVAAKTGEGDHAADGRRRFTGLREGEGLSADVDARRVDEDQRHERVFVARRHRQPPVIGGKSAISRAPARGSE